MSEANLSTEVRRETGKRPAGRFRREGRVPAVVYGLGAEPQSVTVVARELAQILSGAAGANTLITLKVDGGEQLALAREIQRHPVKNSVLHVDFVRVRADQAVSAEVPLQLTGDAEGVTLGGMLEQSLFTVSVEALPNAIPNAITHDISGLGINDQLRVGDLVLPEGVVVSLDPEELVAQVTMPRGMEEQEAAEAAEGAEAVEGEAPGAAAEEGESE